MATAADRERDRRALNALVANARGALAQLLSDVPDAEQIARMDADQVTAIYRTVRDRWWLVGEQYGTMAAALGQAQAAIMLDDLNLPSPRMIPTPVGIPDPESTFVTLTVALSQDDWRGALNRSLDGTIKTANTWAIADVVEGNGAELIWHPSGATTCRYCLQRASYGAYSHFRTEAQAMGFATKPHDGCVLPDTLVHGPALRIGVRRQYDGDVVTVVTALGNEFTVTPNHPVLTRGGWVAAELLHEGDDLIAAAPVERDVLGRPDEDDAPASAEDVFRALAVNPGVIAVTMPGSAEQFHGDGRDSEVEVVVVDSLLGNVGDSSLGEHFTKPGLSEAAPLRSGGGLPLDSCGPGELGGFGLLASADGVVRGGCLGGAFCGAHPACTCEASVRPAANLDTRLQQLPADGLAPNPQGSGDGVLALSGEVSGNDIIGGVDLRISQRYASFRQRAVYRSSADAERFGDVFGAFPGEVPGDRVFRELELLDHTRLDSVIAISRRGYSGLVYNFTSDDGWYFANSIVTHNCDCRPQVIPPDGTYPDDYHPTEYSRQVQQMDREKAERAYDRKLDGAKTPGPKTRENVRRDRSAQAWADRQRIERERDAAKKRLSRAKASGNTDAMTEAQQVLDRTAAERAALNGTR